MSKKAIIGTLLSFILITCGIVYAITNSLQHNKKRVDTINNEKAIISTAKAPNELKDGEYQASAEGYEGPITVKVIIKDGKIFSVDVISQNETPEYYELAKKVLQSIVEKNTFNVDSISGATVTSDAIKIAVYKALLQAGAKSSDIAINLEKDNKELREKEKSKISEKLSNIVAGTVRLTNENLKDGTFIGTGFGYNGPIRVSVTVRNGVIVAANVINHSEDYPYFGWALRVLSNILSGNKNVDTVSGATVSSRGILNAVNHALLQAGAGKKQFEVEQISKTDENTKQNKSNETDTEQIKQSFRNLIDGVYVGNSSGYYNNSIQVKVTVQNGKISNIELVKNNDDLQYFNSDKAKILEERIVSNQSTDIDTVTNATVSSKGYINAVVDALKKAVNPNGNEADKYINHPHSITTYVGKDITVEQIKNAFVNLPENVNILVEHKAKIDTLGKSEMSVQITFKDGSKKSFKIPVNVVEDMSKIIYKDGVYKGVGGGFHNTVAGRQMEVEITVKDNKITDFKLLNFGDDNSYRSQYDEFEKKFIPKIKSNITEVSKIFNSILNWLKREPADYIDVATGATYSNKGVMLAIKDALKQSENAAKGKKQEIKDLVFSKKPNKAVVYFGEKFPLDEFELLIRHWDPNKQNIVVKMNELEKYGIKVNIPKDTIISKNNIKTDRYGFFDITFTHKETEKELSMEFQPIKKTVYVRPLKEIELEFENGTKKTIHAEDGKFNYNVDVSEKDYPEENKNPIKTVKAKDSNGNLIKINEEKSKFHYGTYFINLENNTKSGDEKIEKDRESDSLNITLKKLKKQEENIPDENENEDEDTDDEEVEEEMIENEDEKTAEDENVDKEITEKENEDGKDKEENEDEETGDEENEDEETAEEGNGDAEDDEENVDKD